MARPTKWTDERTREVMRAIDWHLENSDRTLTQAVTRVKLDLGLPETVAAIRRLYQREKYEQKYAAVKERAITLFQQWGARPKAATERTTLFIEAVERRQPAEHCVASINQTLDRAAKKRRAGVDKVAWIDWFIAKLLDPNDHPRPEYQHPRRREASERHRTNMVLLVKRLGEADKQQIMAATGLTTGGADYHLRALTKSENSPLLRSRYGKYVVRKRGAVAYKFGTQAVREIVAEGPATVAQMVDKSGVDIKTIRYGVEYLKSRGEITVKRVGHLRTYALAGGGK